MRNTIQIPKLCDEIAKELRKKIFSQELPLESKIIERDLSEAFGTSRTPIREALKILEQEMLVVNEPRKGYYVKGLTIKDVREIYSLRANLEVFALEGILNKGDRTCIETLRSKVSAVESILTLDKAEIDRLSSKMDMSFHGTLVALSDHERLIQTWNNLYWQYQMVASVLADYYRAAEIYKNLCAHEDLVEAFLTEDKDSCKDILHTHIMAACERLVVRLEASGYAGSNSVD
jgi:DNA-binding GntR family transcriptional regulator